MEIQSRSFLVVALSLAAIVSASPALADGAAGGGPAVGTTIGKDNWQAAEGMLPPEVLEHYKKGEYQNRVVDWPAGAYRFEKAFEDATAANRGKYEVNEAGTIIDKSTGKQPPFVYGFPFPDIDPKDPKAGTKILWNSYYGYWYQGNSHNDVRLVWVNPTGIDREAGQEVYFLYYDGQPETARMANPQNLLMQFIATTTSPTDLQGTTALAWRYRDADKRDSTWAYVPSLRRTRQVSPTNRSDGFLGSDMSSDDGPFFDGKPEDFEWKLLEGKDQLRYVDPLSMEGKGEQHWLPTGGWRAIWPRDLASVGFQDPSWKGLPWAPVGPQLAKRPMWIIEAVPKDKYYLYGKIQLYVDKETYQGAFNRKFSWQGDLMNTYYVLGMLTKGFTRPDGHEDRIWASNMGFQTAENIKMNRATVSGLQIDGKEPASDRRLTFEPSFFDFNSLQRFGK
ncbi:MAG: outer membrane lipoprotein-sorting protein [Alphaproteobacteria bacterium]